MRQKNILLLITVLLLVNILAVNGAVTTPTSCTKDCSIIYGPTFQKCPSDGTGAPEKCCKSGEQCCHKKEDAEPICCEAEPKHTCSTKGAKAKLFGKDGNICKINDCSHYPERTQLCVVGDSSICCLPAPTEDCSYDCLGRWIPTGFFGHKCFGVAIPTCVKGGCDATKGEFECDNAKKGKICCKQNEECKKKLGFGWCTVKECKDSETFCPGTGEWEDIRNNCCKAGTVCYHSPNGFPRCIPVQPQPQNTQKNPATNSIDLSTNSFSFYLVRDSQNFDVNGEAYHIKTEGEANLAYAVTMNFDLGQSNIPLENAEIYRYEEPLASCITDTSFSSSVDIGPSGGLIEFPGLSITVPQNAVDKTVLLTVEIVNLECYDKAKEDSDLAMLSTVLSYPEDITTAQVIDAISEWVSNEISSEELKGIIELYIVT